MRVTLVLERRALTLCSSGTGWVGGTICSSHAASLSVDTIASVSARALGCVSTS